MAIWGYPVWENTTDNATYFSEYEMSEYADYWKL